MRKTEQMIKYNEVVSFYEKKIEECLCKGDVDLATNWYYEMCGACFLAEQQGLIDDPQAHHDRQRELFQRILNAKYGHVEQKKNPLQMRVHLQGVPRVANHTMKTQVFYHDRVGFARGCLSDAIDTHTGLCPCGGALWT